MIQRACSSLRRLHSSETGWGFEPEAPPDPTFTSYALHGLFDVVRFWGAQVLTPQTDKALSWLAEQQQAEGSWFDWHGIPSSPEATGYALYILLSGGVSPTNPAVLAAVDWLLGIQSNEGWWPLSPSQGNRANNWVTYSVLVGLRAFLCAAIEHESTKPGKRRSHRRRVINCDELPRMYSEDGHLLLPSEIPESEELSSNTLHRVYSGIIEVDLSLIPATRPLDHTMFRALDEYVRRKIPHDAVAEILESEGTLELHGMFPEHFELLQPTLPYREIAPVPAPQQKPAGALNSLRPAFFRARKGANGAKVLLVMVSPGHDYLLHYALMCRHLVHHHTQKATDYVRAYRYPLAEKHIPALTGLTARFLRKDDVVILGHVDDLRSLFAERFGLKPTTVSEGRHYVSYGYSFPRAVSLLGVRHSYWGSISEVLTYALCVLGASEIIYTAKLGTLTSADDVYTRIFCPSRYMIMSHDTIRHSVAPEPPNGILSLFPALNSGLHVSVPTVLEEDYSQREVMTRHGAISIDNEISQMARAIATFNSVREKKVSFSAVHFATDYVRPFRHRSLVTSFDLSSNRTEQARNAKRAILARICCDILQPYLSRP